MAVTVFVILAMVGVGVLVGVVAGIIWKDNRPIGVQGDMIVAIISSICIGLLDWYVIPAMGFSDSLKYIGIAVEPALGALLVLWVIRLAKK